MVTSRISILVQLKRNGVDTVLGDSNSPAGVSEVNPAITESRLDGSLS